MSFGAHTETIGILADLWIADYLGSISAALSFCWAVSYKSPPIARNPHGYQIVGVSYDTGVVGIYT